MGSSSSEVSPETLQNSTKKAADNQPPDRGNWDSKLEYLLSSIGYAVGLGNVWRFPYLCYKNGGGAFLLPYIIVLFLCGLPIFLLESSLGQFSSQGPVRAFNGMPLIKGIGFGMVAVSIFICTYYNVILSWTVYYLYQAMRCVLGRCGETGLPWKDCRDSTADPDYAACYSREKSSYCTNLKKIDAANFTTECQKYDERRTAVDIFYHSKVLGLKIPTYPEELINATKQQRSLMPSMEEDGVINADVSLNMEFGSIQPHLATTLFISWVLIGLAIIRGVKSSGKTMYFTATFPYVVLTILLLRGLVLEGALDGIKFFITPRLSELKNIHIWKDAAIQIFYSLSVSWGGLLTLSSYNPFRNNVYRDTFIVVCCNSATSIYAGFAIFAYIGYLANTLGLKVEDVVSSGAGLAFIVWPEAMATLSTSAVVAGIFSLLFFGMLYSLGMSTMIVTVETICTSILDIFPRLRENRGRIVLAICSVLFLFGLALVTEQGLYWFQIFDDYCASYSLLFSATVQMLSVVYIYGVNRFANDIKMMTDIKLHAFFTYSWSYITPIILFIVLVYNIIDHSASNITYKYSDNAVKYTIPDNVMWLPTILVFTPITIFVGLIFRQMHQKGWNWSEATKPTRHWGPLTNKDRADWNHIREDNVEYLSHEAINGGGEEKAPLKKNIVEIDVNDENSSGSVV